MPFNINARMHQTSSSSSTQQNSPIRNERNSSAASRKLAIVIINNPAYHFVAYHARMQTLVYVFVLFALGILLQHALKVQKIKKGKCIRRTTKHDHNDYLKHQLTTKNDDYDEHALKVHGRSDVWIWIACSPKRLTANPTFICACLRCKWLWTHFVFSCVDIGDKPLHCKVHSRKINRVSIARRIWQIAEILLHTSAIDRRAQLQVSVALAVSAISICQNMYVCCVVCCPKTVRQVL